MIETFGKLIGEFFRQKKTIPEFVRENYPSSEERTKIRTIRRYLSEEVVPQYSAARELIDLLGIDISEEDLISILNYSRNEREASVNYKHSYLFEKISARVEDIFKNSDVMAYEKQNMFVSRVNEVADGNIKNYLIKLIEYDLENNVSFSEMGNGSPVIEDTQRKPVGNGSPAE